MQTQANELARWVVAHRKKPPTLWERFEAIIQRSPGFWVCALFLAAAWLEGAM